VRKYVLTIQAGVIFPNNTWPAGGKTPTLTSIQEYGLGGNGSLPATSFTYADGMHLTQAKNGYGGVIDFTMRPTMRWKDRSRWSARQPEERAWRVGSSTRR
jgi:hypothetical protein